MRIRHLPRHHRLHRERLRTLTSTKDSGNYVGTLVGTANVGQITVDAASSASGNTLKQNSSASEEASDKILGRDAVNDAGLVIVDNKVVAAGTAYGDIVNKNANEVLVEVSEGSLGEAARRRRSL